jgi:hypothetical protein
MGDINERMLSMNETPTKAAWKASLNECSMNETPTKAAWEASICTQYMNAL